MAQVSGVVKSNMGEVLPGAIVRWIGEKKAVSTNEDGKFHLNAWSGEQKIITSCVGFGNDTTEVKPGGKEVEITLYDNASIAEAVVTGKHTGTFKSFNTIQNVDMITSDELCRAACCNLGEAFVTNPAVDVSYSDAATGAKQIRLLGLSGTYVQMLTENIPNFRVVASPYGLGYVPGPWMESISVSKGISSVKNGYEAITGQINVEYKKPQKSDADWWSINLFGSSDGKVEGNTDATFKIGEKWSTTIIGHYEKELLMHDSNDDGFADYPKVEQINAMNRWAYMGDKYVFQAGIKLIDEKRESGQLANKVSGTNPLYNININTRRYEAFAKNAVIFDKEHNTNLALILSGSWHNQNAAYGYRQYDVEQTHAYASLMFENEFTHSHALSTGLSFNYDGFNRATQLERLPGQSLQNSKDGEMVPGLYAQYTYTLGDKFVAMAGIRADYSDIFGTFVTPRAHLKYTPNSYLNFRVSAGKGYRTAHVLDENNYLLSGSRRIDMPQDPLREEAINFGASAGLKLPIADRMLNVTLEYYYTDFMKQAVVDLDTDPHAAIISQLNGKSYSHVAQIEASYPFFDGFTLTAAYRLSDVRCTYNGELREKPLNSRYKALLTASYKTSLELWQFDATLQYNGGGRMPDAYVVDTDVDGNAIYSWDKEFKSFPQLSAQVTRYFRFGSVYIGGENLTNFKQKNPIINAQDPWSDSFDPTMVWGPVHGWKVYAGLRFNIARN
jgi:outer membrane receptor for ferrienterochelin and colicin